ncbi:hypothetical protein [Escherichia coli]|uniref:hypothetical protein n=4 Tax=Escherichia coli TaxID=562 RepID=UPI0028983763|nr:hypothetical protein [Escherichia coli]
MKIPSSFRFPEQLMIRLKTIAKSQNRTLTEYVQTVLETSIESEDFEKKQFYEFMADPEKTISNIYIKLFKITESQVIYLSLSEIKFMVHHCHQAYLSYKGIVSHDYINVIVDITLDFIKASLNHIAFNKNYVYRCLELSDETLIDDIIKLREEINQGIKGSWAEYLTRPLADGVFDYRLYERNIIDSIFTKERLIKLFPLAVRGVMDKCNKPWEVNITNENISSYELSFDISDFTFSIECSGTEVEYKELASIYFLIKGRHFIRPCLYKTLLALIRLVKIDEVKGYSLIRTGSEDVSIYYAPSLNPGEVTIDIDAFRLFFTIDEYREFKKSLLNAIKDEKMALIIYAMKNQQGDI